MRTKDELFREALRHIAARRQQAVTAAERDRAAALAAHPELRAAEDARTHAGLTLTLAAARGADQTAAAAALKAADERLTAAYATLGLGPEGFVPHYTCPTCKDTGMVNGRPCSCVAEAARTLRREEINAASPLALCSFDTFELDRYPAEPEPELGGTPRDYLGKVLAYCQRYANSFTPESCWRTAGSRPAVRQQLYAGKPRPDVYWQCRAGKNPHGTCHCRHSFEPRV